MTVPGAHIPLAISDVSWRRLRVIVWSREEREHTPWNAWTD